MAFTPVYGNASVSLIKYLSCQMLFLQRIALYGIIFDYKSANKKGANNDSGKQIRPNQSQRVCS